MSPKGSLPVILVSACDRATAEDFIAELIDNEVSEVENGEVQTGENGLSAAGSGRVWRLVNKYYTADVMVSARGDDEPPPAAARVEAHVLYFTAQECESGAASVCLAERRAASRAAVRVAALRAARGGALGAWAARARYEPVPLLDDAPPEEPGEAQGLARVREALHAHPWPGLRRLDRNAPAPLYHDSEDSSCGEEEEEEEGEDEEACVERAEQFAAALGALGAARDGPAGDAERRLRAEQLLAAFCEALGHRLDC